MKALPWRVIRRFKQLAIILLVAVTTYVTLGRLLMPLVSARKDTIEQQIAAALGVPVTIEAIQGSWFRFGPSLTVTGILIGEAATPEVVQRIERVELVLDVPETLLAQAPIVSRISADKLNLVVEENAEGKWGLAGLPSQSGASTDPLIDFLLNTRVLTVREGNVELRRNTGQRYSLNSIFLNIENRFSNHLGQLQLRINGQDSPARVNAELNGDPRRSFFASVFLDTQQLDLLALLKDKLPPQWQWQTLQGQARMWATIDSNGLQSLDAEVQDVDAIARHSDGQHQIALQHASLRANARTRFDAEEKRNEWSLNIQDIGFDWQNKTWLLGKLMILTSHAPALRLDISADAVDAAMVTQLVSDAVVMPEAGKAALDTLAARGIVRNLHLATATDGSYPQLFHLRGNLEEVAVNAWHQAPSGSGLNGYVEATAAGGFAEVDSNNLTLHLPLLFERPWHFDKVNTRVRWQAGKDDVRVQSAVINVKNPQLAGEVHFDVHNVRVSEQDWSNEFTLNIGMQQMQVEAAPDFLPTVPSVQDTMQWLRSSLKGGELGESAFFLHSMSGTAVAAPVQTVASWYRARDATLKFLPDWPALMQATASVVQRNNEVDVIASAGNIAGIEVSSASAIIRPVRDTQILSIRADASASTAVGLDFLRNTPVHETVGSFLDSWQGKGTLALKVGLGIDLHDHKKPPHVHVQTRTSDSELDMKDFDLQFAGIKGEVVFDTRHGLAANRLASRLFDADIMASISTTRAGSPQQVIKIEGNGKVAVPRLQQWSGQPAFVRELLNYTQGEVDYKAVVTIDQNPQTLQRQSTVKLDSDLIGMTSTLPSPLGKSREQITPLDLELGFAGDNRTFNFRYRDLLTGSLQLDTVGIRRGLVSVGERNRNFNVRQTDNNAEGVLVNGDLDNLDVMLWEEIARAMNKAGGGGREAADYLRLVDVNIGKLKLPGVDFDKVNLVIRHPGKAWVFDARNDTLAGHIELPDDAAKPWQVMLDYLRLPAKPVVDKSLKNPPEEPDPLQDLDPTKLPAFDFVTKELSEGEHKLGAFSFNYRPVAGGANINNFIMQSEDAKITDAADKSGAAIEWRYDQGKHQSKFTGVFAAGDLAKVLPTFGHDANVISDTASFTGSLQWPGSPLHFSIKHLSGDMKVLIEDGRFVDISKEGARLLGAFNFDALVRRLKLDFSDVFAKGYSFDSINGEVHFTDGVLTTVQPLRIDGPSSDLTINGEINLRDETIAADMEVKMPLGGNVSMVVALLGAWPVAVSTYLASKIFKNQIDDFATVLYRLEGPWDKASGGFEPPPEAAAAAGSGTDPKAEKK